jgi:transcriptional regulator with XRE-family HTH domain
MLTPSLLTPDATMAVTDKAFYQQLGRRVAERRKALGITQVELAKTLGIAQQTLAHYEGGTLRVAVALLSPLSLALKISIDEVIGETQKAEKASGKRGPAPKIQQQLERVNALPKARQRVIAEVLDSMLAQARD